MENSNTIPLYACTISKHQIVEFDESKMIVIIDPNNNACSYAPFESQQ